MPVHDWTRVDAGVFHDFHAGWIPALRTALNSGVLPEGFYAMAEQHVGRAIPDILTLHSSAPAPEPVPASAITGGTAIAEAPPKVRHRETLEAETLSRQRTVAIRHVSGHRLIALAEIVSPANKDRRDTVDDFVSKVISALHRGIHVLVIDLFPPGPSDPEGIHGAIRQQLDGAEGAHVVPPDEPLTLASYAAGPRVEVYREQIALGAALPDMPLFLRHDRYVDVPLESTYELAYAGLPAYWRSRLDFHPT
jgi:hypothetical protein